MYNPPHPGETLREDVLPALGLSVTDAADQLGVTRAALSRVLNGRAGINCQALQGDTLLHDMSHMYALKSAVEDLLGNQAWLDLKETTSTATWRRYVLKLLDAIELSIETTVLVKDENWMQEVRSNLNHGRELARIAQSPEDAIAALSGTLLRQVFLQLGTAPNRQTVKAVPLKASHWDFSGFRSVQYVQTPQQKEDLFRSKQRRAIGLDAQIDLEAEYRKSGSKLLYSEWCATRAA